MHTTFLYPTEIGDNIYDSLPEGIRRGNIESQGGQGNLKLKGKIPFIILSALFCWGVISGCDSSHRPALETRKPPPITHRRSPTVTPTPSPTPQELSPEENAHLPLPPAGIRVVSEKTDAEDFPVEFYPHAKVLEGKTLITEKTLDKGISQKLVILESADDTEKIRAFYLENIHESFLVEDSDQIIVISQRPTFEKETGTLLSVSITRDKDRAKITIFSPEFD